MNDIINPPNKLDNPFFKNKRSLQRLSIPNMFLSKSSVVSLNDDNSNNNGRS